MSQTQEVTIDPIVFDAALAIRTKLRSLGLVQDAPEAEDEQVNEGQYESLEDAQLAECRFDLQEALLAEGYEELLADPEWQEMTLEEQLEFLAEADDLSEGVKGVLKKALLAIPFLLPGEGHKEVKPNLARTTAAQDAPEIYKMAKNITKGQEGDSFAVGSRELSGAKKETAEFLPGKNTLAMAKAAGKPWALKPMQGK